MAYSFFAELDKQWLRDIIADKEKESRQVNGALVSEALSDAFVLASGVAVGAQSIWQQDLNLFSYKSLIAIQLGCAYLALKSLYDQKTKIDNDLHVLKAILELDENTPENITAMLKDYIAIHADPDQPERPGLEVKRLSSEALATIQRNFRQKRSKETVWQKAGYTASFLRYEFTNAVCMMGETVRRPREFFNAASSGSKAIKRLWDHWDEVRVNRDAQTTRESLLYNMRRAERDSTRESPRSLRDMLGEDMANRVNYLHQQQASLRTVTRLRIETARGVAACAAIIGIAGWQMATAGGLGVAGMALYTIVASLPSLKVLAKELDDLTRTTDIYGPKVTTASNDFTISMAQRALGQ